MRLLALVFAAVAFVQSPPVLVGGATWLHKEAGKDVQTAVILIYDDARLGVWPETKQKNGRRIADPKATAPLLEFRYVDITAAEHSLTKSLNVKEAMAIGAVGLLDRVPSHWLTLKSRQGDTATLKLDPESAQLALATLEQRAKLTITNVAEKP